jgi:hypothetical protein
MTGVGREPSPNGGLQLAVGGDVGFKITDGQ